MTPVEDDDLLGRESERRCKRLGRRDRVCLALGTRCRVCDSRVDKNRLGLRRNEMALRDGHGRRLHAVRGPERSAHGRQDGAHDGDIRLPGRPDARRDAARNESLCGRHRHRAQTSTP